MGDYFDTPEGKRNIQLYLLGVNDNHLPLTRRARLRRIQHSLREAVLLLILAVVIIAAVMLY